MSKINPILFIEIDPVTNPVQEICSVIIAVGAYHKDKEDLILQNLEEAITHRRAELKGAEANDKPALQPDTVS